MLFLQRVGMRNINAMQFHTYNKEPHILEWCSNDAMYETFRQNITTIMNKIEM